MRSLRAPVAVALTILVATGPAAGAATGWREPDRSVFGPRNVNVSRLTSNQAETSVAINPTDPENIVVTSNLATFRGLLEAYSSDGGATWKTQIIANGDDLGLACCDSSLAFDSYGNLFLTYLVLTGFHLPVEQYSDNAGRQRGEEQQPRGSELGRTPCQNAAHNGPQARAVDHEHGPHSGDVQHDLHKDARRVHACNHLKHPQVTRARHGKKLGEPLHQPKDDALPQGHATRPATSATIPTSMAPFSSRLFPPAGALPMNSRLATARTASCANSAMRKYGPW